MIQEHQILSTKLSICRESYRTRIRMKFRNQPCQFFGNRLRGFDSVVEVIKIRPLFIDLSCRRQYCAAL